MNPPILLVSWTPQNQCWLALRLEITGMGNRQKSPWLRSVYERCLRHEFKAQGRKRLFQYNRTIAAFAKVLKRNPQASDLTAENWTRANEAWRASEKISEQQRRALRTCLRRIWEGCHQRQLCGPPEAPRGGPGPKPRTPRQPKPRTPRQPKPPRVPLGIAALPPAEPGTIRHFALNVYIPERCFASTAAHLEGINATLARMFKFFGCDVTIAEQSDALLAQYLRSLVDQGLSANSVNRHRVHWLMLWRYAHEKRLIERLPRVRRMKVDLDTPDAWSLDEVAMVIAAGGRRKGYLGSIRAGDFWPAFLLTIYWSALRLGSMLRLRPQDFDAATGVLTVPGQAMKNRKGQAFILGEDAVEAIRRILDPLRERLFPWPFGRNVIYRHMREIIADAGVPQPTRRGLNAFHKLRRSTATEAARNGGLSAAMELLGHSSTKVTERYIDPSKLPSKDTRRFLTRLSIPSAENAEGST